MDYLRKWVIVGILQDAQVAQIKGEFINWIWEVQFIFHYVKYKLKRYKSCSDLYLFAKVVVVVRIAVRDVFFLQKNRAYKLDEFF